MHIRPLRGANLKGISCEMGSKVELRDGNQHMLWCCGQDVQDGVRETGQGVHGGVWETGQAGFFVLRKYLDRAQATRSPTQVHSTSRSTSGSQIERMSFKIGHSHFLCIMTT